MSRPKMKSLTEMWVKFRDGAVPQNVTPREVHALKLAFMGGAAYMFDEVAITIPEYIDAQGVRHLSELQQQLKDFACEEKERQSADRAHKN